MLKKILLLSLIAAASFTATAQDFKKSSSITIAVGPTFPTGEFANKDLFNEKAGLAAVGGHASIGYGYQFSKFFGLVTSVSGRLHGVDKDALNAYTLPTGSGASLSLESGTWQFFRFMAGVSQVLPITQNEKLSLEFKELVGIQISNSPELRVSGSIPGVGVISDFEESQSVTSLALDLGLGLTYKLGENIGLKLFGDYQGSGPKFAYDDFSTGAVVKQKMTQKTGAISVGLGFIIGL